MNKDKTKEYKTVKDLIEYLSTLEQDRMVLTRGYEGGYCDITTADEREIERDIHSEWYYGNHDDADYYSTRDEDKPIYKAYIL